MTKFNSHWRRKQWMADFEREVVRLNSRAGKVDWNVMAKVISDAAQRFYDEKPTGITFHEFLARAVLAAAQTPDDKPPIRTCPKCGAQGIAFICSTPGCPVNSGAAYGP